MVIGTLVGLGLIATALLSSMFRSSENDGVGVGLEALAPCKDHQGRIIKVGDATWVCNEGQWGRL
jgi:hypothetical protein